MPISVLVLREVSAEENALAVGESVSVDHGSPVQLVLSLRVARGLQNASAQRLEWEPLRIFPRPVSKRTGCNLYVVIRVSTAQAISLLVGGIEATHCFRVPALKNVGAAFTADARVRQCNRLIEAGLRSVLLSKASSTARFSGDKR